MGSVHAIVMAAGKGTRLKSELPKVLHPLFGKALLRRVLDTLSQLSVQQTYVIVGHGRDQVEQALATWQLPLALQIVVQEPQLGTGHAVQQVKNQVTLSGSVLILSGDVPLLRPESLHTLLETHQAQGNHLSIMTAHLENPFGYGRVLTDNTGRVLKIVEEKDASPAEKAVQEVNTGIYCLQWESIAPLLDALSSENAQGEFYLTDTIALAVEKGLQVGTVALADAQDMLGVNSRHDLARCHQVLNQRTQAHLMSQGVTILSPETTLIAPEVSVGADTVIYPGCFLQGEITIGQHCAVGPHTTLMGRVLTGDHVTLQHSLVRDTKVGDHTWIGPFAHLRDGVEISHHVKIGNFVEVKNAKIGHHSNAAHLSYLGDTELGVDVNMGAGSITANYDPVRDIKEKTIIEDGVKVGCNSVLIAPLTVKERACVAAGSVITKNVNPWDLAIARAKQTEIPGWVKKVVSDKPTAPSV